MTLRNWLQQFSTFDAERLDLPILIECHNGLMVTPEIRLWREGIVYDPEARIKALVITP